MIEEHEMIASFEAFTESVIEALEGNENETVNIQADLKGIKFEYIPSHDCQECKRSWHCQ